MFIAILQHTPTWVFVLLLALIGLGVSQSFPRALSLRRSTMLPLLMVGLSLIGVVSAFGGQALALPAWAVGLAAALAALHRRVDVSRVRYSAATQRFALPGIRECLYIDVWIGRRC